MKTPLRNLYIDRLAEVNDQLCYFHFVDEELRQVLNQGSFDEADMTTDVFPDNPFSSRIHVKIGSLGGFRERSRASVAGTSVAFGVEHLLSFLDDLLDLKCRVSGLDKIENDADSIEDYLSKCLTNWGVTLASPTTDFLKTVRYLRLRRNHIAHVRDSLTDGFEQFIRQNSHHLNKFWNARTSMPGFDFADQNVASFSEDEAYTCMKLLRVCVEEIDSLVADTLSQADLILFEETAVLANDPQIKNQMERIGRKVRRRLIQDFGVDMKPEFVESHLQ